METTRQGDWPQVRTAGYDGFVVTFGAHLSEAANRAALAFRAAIRAANWDAVEETSTSLVSAYLRFDPQACDHARMRQALEHLVTERDWYATPLPPRRRLWRVPTVFGGAAGPQLAEAAQAAGLSPADAITSLCRAPVRVQTIGFAPGMPYLGSLSPEWNIPRQTDLTARVPAGGLCVALRQLVLFPVATPTGWRHIGQTALRLFRPEGEAPFLLRPGDEIQFEPVDPDQLAALGAQADGGARSEPLP